MAKDLNVYLGTSNKTKVFWNPKEEKNPHLITVGGSGSGKTETLKAIMLELKQHKIKSLILDFHNDFKVFADNLVQIDKATLHPLEVQINEKPLDVCYKVSKMIASVFSLGDVQEAIIREAIKAFYLKSGIKDIKKANDGTIELLPFSFFRDIIFDTPIRNQGVSKLLAKISVLFDVDLFMEADGTSLSLDTIIKNLSVIELLDFPTDEVKALVADLLLKKLINFLYIKGKCEDYWLYVIIDEAHRMMYPGSPVELLLRESRKYGVGIILASQRPTDFSETILANAGTIIAFQESLDKDAVFLSKQLRIPKVNFQKLKTAGLGYYLFSSKDETEKIQITPVKDRSEYKKIESNFDEEERSDYFNKELKRIQKEKDRYKALEETNQKQEQEIKELDKEILDLNGEIERKEYSIKKTEAESKEKQKEIIKLSHENDKLGEKLDLREDKIIRLEKKLNK
ncbi:DUF87 domain-containing protein [Candidatus Woesearchaeota archaeon]|jgi:hypothetical protein|nr:DUF87 domain-containing protein [Candidatus Woesearchaeota archaeon]MBT4110864.1 DUF87 domain-containing protein [Candidatus Woesearchaeota archaeon]MBT4336624.1 DUF87 domain-containing protein [Candidatus Woesearchaeota archaeon]MBT4469627.1 DUF87 domain-containing protein [Candidatus Woesearchaeota archaeon]MBT6743989.1 DUF87 domain-containing protein [Candidatus Woesearchaeota archaeon]